MNDDDRREMSLPEDPSTEGPSTEDRLLEDLAALQRQLEAEPSGERAERLERPLDSAFRQRLLHRIQEEQRSQTATEADPLSQRPSQPQSLRDDGTSPVVRRLPISKWLPPLALAAGLAILFLSPGTTAPLPEYALEVRGQIRQQRSLVAPSLEEIPQLSIDGSLRLLMRPATSVEGPLEAVAMALSDSADRKVPLSSIEYQVSDLGALQLEAPVAALGLSPGRWTLIVAVGRPEHLPDWRDLPDIASDDGRCVLRQTVEVVAPADGDG